MDVLKISVILVMAWLFGSCCGDEPVGEEDNSSSTGDVMVEFSLSLSESNAKDEAVFNFLNEGDGEMEVRVYMFRSQTPTIDESFICVSPHSGEGAEPYIKIPLSANYSGALNIETSADYYYRFMAIGFRLSGQKLTIGEQGAYVADVGSDEEGSASRDMLMIDCLPGTRWTDARVRDMSENPVGRVGEFYSGIAVADRLSGSIDYQISGGSLKVDVELRRAFAGLVLCVDNVPHELVSDFTFHENEGIGLGAGEEVITQGESYIVDRVSIISPGISTGYLPGATIISEDYHSGVTELVSVELPESGTWTPAESFSNGELVLPVRLSGKSIVGNGLTLNRSSLYLAIHTAVDVGVANARNVRDEGNRRFYPIRVIPVRMSAEAVASGGDLTVGPDDDGWISADRFRFNLQANHLYCLGTPESPIDLSRVIRSENADIEVNGNYQVDVNIPF